MNPTHNRCLGRKASFHTLLLCIGHKRNGLERESSDSSPHSLPHVSTHITLNIAWPRARHLTKIWSMPSIEAPISAPLSSEVCPLSPFLECSSIQLGLPMLFLSHNHALASMSVACRPPCFAGILKQGSQGPYLRFVFPNRLVQLSRGFPAI
jgi:hypothetical protein